MNATPVELPTLDEDQQEEAFVGLAQNPAASAKTLLALLEHVPDSAHAGLMGASRLDQRPGPLPDEVVEAIVSRYPGDADHLQKDDRVSTAMRQKLAETAKRRAAAGQTRAGRASRHISRSCPTPGKLGGAYEHFRIGRPD